MDILLIATLFAWGMLVGGVFSTIGAAGGILTSFGLITLFGVLEPNSVKPMTQLVVLATVVIFVPGYLRRSALVLPLGLLLGAGGVVGAYIGSTLSSFYLSDMETFRPLFGALTLAIAAQLIWNLARQYRNSDAEGIQTRDTGIAVVTITSFSFRAVSFSYGATNYHVPTWSPIIAGAAISMTASIFGVGGGFLLVPYLSVVLGMPMHIIPATAAVAIFMSLIVSIGNFLVLGAVIRVEILLAMIIGSMLGAIAGPVINRTMKNSWLQALMALIVAAIGMKYVIV